MAGAQMTPVTAEQLRLALNDPAVQARYRVKIATVPGYDCQFWTAAVSGRGHGRFWISETAGQQDHAVIAHRFGYGLTHGYDALLAVEVVAHTCDNPLCQNPEHWRESTHARNRAEWAARRHQLSGPLRDLRGARGRAIAIRDAVRDGTPLPAVIGFGVRELDRTQLALWD